MQSKYNITSAELPIIKKLWDKGEMTSPELFDGMEGNINTLKTLLKRLVSKGSVAVNKVKTRTYSYYAAITRDEYLNYERKGFLNRVFDGSKKKMLLNFVKEENITKSDLEELIKMIEED